ncbi:MAG: hypothetical protein JNM21_08605 [Taibaiella sp.]|nr:hypothetical protein [Taibaiella sp.]
MSAAQLFFQSMNLNIRYDAPQEVWDQVALIYEKLEGWIGYAYDLPFWFGFDETQKHICASVEPSGLQFSGLMPESEWDEWRKAVKAIATEILGYKLGEIKAGEVDF